MAKIIDPSNLSGSQVLFDTGLKTIELVTGGTFTLDGVSLQTLYSYIKEVWRNDNTLIKFPFPMVAVTAEQFELINGWNFKDNYTITLIRDGGWALKNVAGASQEEYMNVTTLGSFDNSSSDKAYYLQNSAITATDCVFTGPVNQAVKIYGDVTHGNFDYRSFFKIYLRIAQKKYDFYDLISGQNLTTLTYRKYAMPLSYSLDLKVSASDNTI